MADTLLGIAPQEHETRIVFYDPARVARRIATDFVDFRCHERLYDQSTLEIVIANDSALWTMSYSGSTASADLWLNWSFDYYYRGEKRFSGPVVAVRVDEQGEGGVPGTTPMAYAKLVCATWTVWLLSGRTIHTTDGDNWFRTATAWDDICRELVREQCETGQYIEHASYPASTDRDEFGPFTVTVEADQTDASSQDFTVQANKPLLDTVMEMATTPLADTDWLWPYMTETSAGTFQFRVLVGRSGGGRQIGSDLSSTIILQARHGTVATGGVEADHMALTSVMGVAGVGVRENRGMSFVKNSGLYAKIGAREDSTTAPAATNSTDRLQEAYRALAESTENATQAVNLEVVEKTGMKFGANYDLKDTIVYAMTSVAKSFALMIIGADHTMAPPDQMRVKLLFGTMPRVPVREAQRSGGGGRGGGRRQGGKPKDSDGQGRSPRTITHQEGGSITFKEAESTWGATGQVGVSRIRLITGRTTDADINVPGLSTYRITSTYFSGCPTCTGYIRTYAEALGRDVLVLVRDDGAGGLGDN